MLQRTQLTPIFDQYDIDVVLEGHSHTYCRTNLLESDALPHMAFVAKQDPETGRYDTNTIVEKDTGAEFRCIRKTATPRARRPSRATSTRMTAT